MTVRILLPLLAIAAAAAFIPGSRAESPATPDLDREAVHKIVREYLLEHPEVIEEAIRGLQAKRESRKQDRVSAALREHTKALRSHPMSPVSGNPKGDVTLVEFFDYQCGYCKRSLKPVKDLLETDRQLRIVWKEFPILGPVSRFAARAAMASEKQGRYLEFHVAVMGAIRARRSSGSSLTVIAPRMALNPPSSSRKSSPFAVIPGFQISMFPLTSVPSMSWCSWR